MRGRARPNGPAASPRRPATATPHTQRQWHVRAAARRAIRGDRERCAEHDREAHEQYTANGRPMAQRRVEMRIADEQPRESGQHPRQASTRTRPQHARSRTRRSATRPAHPARVSIRPEQRRKTRASHDEQRHQRRRRATAARRHNVDADVDPRCADAYLPTPNPQPRKAARAGARREHPEEHCSGYERERPVVERRECEAAALRRRRARARTVAGSVHQRNTQSRTTGDTPSTGCVGCRHCSTRTSAPRSRSIRRVWADGRTCFSSRPPIVSNSVVAVEVPKRSLKSPRSASSP